MAVNQRDLSTLEGESGWPTVNYAQEDRNFQTTHNGRAGALSIPRFKFTWLVEFNINPRVWENPVTNLREFLKNNRLYTHLVSLDHPSPTIDVEKLRSYNKWISVPKTVEFPTASMTFHDDSTSVVQALWKEHLNFYSHLGQVGDSISGEGTQSNLSSTLETNSYQFTHILTGEEMRAQMETRPSLGLRLKANDMRHFFETITIYDLGTEPDGINVYWFHRPMITAWQHDNLDKEDRTGNVRVTASFDYESYYFTLGQNRGRLADVIGTYLGTTPDNITSAPRKDGIARDGRQSRITRKVENGIESPVGLFPGEDAQILQALQTGAGLNQTDNLATDALNPAEQVASPAGLNSQANQEKQAMEAAGIDTDGQSLGDAARQSGINSTENLAGSTEPVAPKQLAPDVPLALSDKKRDLDRTDTQIDEAYSRLERGEGIPNNAAEEERIAGLLDRRQDLQSAINRQESARADAFGAQTQDALANTLATQPSADAPTSRGVIENPSSAARKVAREEAIAATDTRITNLDNEIDITQQRIDALARGDSNAVIESDGTLNTATLGKALRQRKSSLDEAKSAEIRKREALANPDPAARLNF